ncbi:MAG: sugar phosphate isomerase/epimerase [Oscillospiraceae bacterium]|nr:sugar phosphate isomerase/epimerase [Oscillospiraceae bacterium]
MSEIYLGAQLYTVRDYIQNEKDFAETMKKIADIGYKYVQVSGIGAVSPQAIKNAAEANGLTVTLTHTNPARMRDETEAVIAAHNVFNCNCLGIGGSPYEHSEEGYYTFCKEFAPAIEKIKNAGKMLLFHNHWKEFEKFGDKNGLEIIMENTDPDGCKLTFDAGWGTYAGVDVLEFMDKYADRIYATHLKDMFFLPDNKYDLTEMLTGDINYDAIIKVCITKNIQWHFIEQDTVKMDAFESLKISYNNLVSKYPFK